MADRRLDPFPRESLDLLDGEPSALPNDALDGPVGRRFRRFRHRRDVENLTATDGLVAARLTDDEPVTRQQWERHRKMDAHGTGRTRSERLGAQDAHRDAVLAGTDIREICPAT